MKKKCMVLFLMLSLLLTGCSWMDGSYVYVEPHVEQSGSTQTGTVSASSYSELLAVMEDLVTAGTENSIIDVADYDRPDLESVMEPACRYIRNVSPVGAYAVEEITYEVGSNSGRPAIALSIQYRRSRTELQRIRKKADMDALIDSIHSALDDHSSRVVVLVEEYSETDFNQLVQSYAREHPQTVMEIPQISEGIYGSGSARVVELNFTYQNSRESLRQMQSQVRPVFEAAALYVSGEGSEHQKYTQLCSFLTERFDYNLETSMTPSYSLLCHGVGDSRAFAEVYASMCRRAGLECLIVNGTRDGAPWTWNMVLDNGNYYHVDLVRSNQEGGFREYADTEMTGYVWDFSAYPVCEVFYQEPALLDPTQEETTEETLPEESMEPETAPQEESIEPETTEE